MNKKDDISIPKKEKDLSFVSDNDLSELGRILADVADFYKENNQTSEKLDKLLKETKAETVDRAMKSLDKDLNNE